MSARWVVMFLCMFSLSAQAEYTGFQANPKDGLNRATTAVDPAKPLTNKTADPQKPAASTLKPEPKAAAPSAAALQDPKSEFGPKRAVQVKKYKVVCSQTYRAKYRTSDGSEFNSNYTGKSFEGIKTTWTRGNTEYEFFEGTLFANGKAVGASRSNTKTIKAELNGKLLNYVERTFVDQRYPSAGSEIWGENPDEGKFTLEHTYEDLGNGQRHLIKSVVNGKEQHADIYHSEHSVSDDITIEIEHSVVPYQKHQDDGTVVSVTADDQVCQNQEILDQSASGPAIDPKKPN